MRVSDLFEAQQSEDVKNMKSEVASLKVQLKKLKANMDKAADASSYNDALDAHASMHDKIKQFERHIEHGDTAEMFKRNSHTGRLNGKPEDSKPTGRYAARLARYAKEREERESKKVANEG
jgi:hypothetical protein